MWPSAQLHLRHLRIYTAAVSGQRPHHLNLSTITIQNNILGEELMKKFVIVLVGVSGPLLSGCGMSFFSDRETNPIIQDIATSDAREINVYGTTASRRIVLTRENLNGASSNATDSFTMCAEPPPDVAETFAAALAGGLRSGVDLTQGTDTKAGAEIAGQFARQLSTQIAPLIFRTQGLQLYRDAQFGLCVDRLNNTINNDQYMNEKNARFNRAVELIDKELPLMKEVAMEYYKSVKSGESKINVSDLKELLAAVKPEATQKPAAAAEKK